MDKKLNDLKILNVLFWGVIRRPRTNADRIHRSFAIYFWKNNKSIKVRLVAFLLFLVSPFPIISLVNRRVRKLSKIARRLSGKSILRQWLEQFYLAYFYSITPRTYYLMEFYHEDGMKRAREYVIRDTLKHGVYTLIKSYLVNACTDKRKTPLLSDKVEVSKYLLQNGVPAVPVLMEFQRNGFILDYQQDNEDAVLPQRDIFCKPRSSKGGKDAELWYYQYNGQYVNPAGEVVTHDELMLKLRANGHNHGSYIVQPLILPHPDLAEFRIHATPSLRIISYYDGKDVNIDSIRFKFSLNSDSVVDNTHAGGVSVPIDLTTGTMTIAIESKLKKLKSRWEEHELLSLPIRGRKVPYLDETVKLVKRAHRLFPSDFIVGWDIVISKTGPVIIEGNDQPDSTLPQRAYLVPYGSKEIGKLMAELAEKALEALY